MDFPLKSFYALMSSPINAELALYLISYGREIRYSTDYFQDGRKRFDDVLIWQYTLAGRGELRVGEKIYPVRPGEALIIKAPSDCSYYLPENSDHWDFIFFTLQGNEAIRMADEFQKNFGPAVPFLPDGKLLQMLHELFYTSHDRMLDACFNSATAYKLLMEMFSEATRGGEKDDDKLLRKIRQHILVNMEHNPDVAELAAIAGCSPWHFSRKFRKISGVSPRQYILALKMQYAAQLLENTLDSIKEAAQKCGYDDPSYFCKVFRKFHRVSPGKFRDQESSEW